MAPESKVLVGTKAFVWLLLCCASVSAQVLSPPRVAVAVLEFDYGSVKLHWPSVQTSRGSKQIMPSIDALDVGRGIANLLVAELAMTGELRLLERQRIADVAREHLAGEEVRARYLVMGSVTRFGGEQKTRAGAAIATTAIGIVTRMPLLAMLKTKDTRAYVGLSYRVVDTTTGEIVRAGNASGESRRRGLLLGALGGGQRITGAGVSLDSADFQATILGEATVLAVKDAATQLRLLFTGVS